MSADHRAALLRSAGALVFFQLDIQRPAGNVDVDTGRATAGMCNAVLVDPPIAISTRIAFSNAAGVMMSWGVVPRLTSSTIYRPGTLILEITNLFFRDPLIVDEPVRSGI
jgi:hypothetical protein